ncbi:cupin domain-containing protein [Candidatus Arthromitus sp. SFB-rat-Yit]|uniref:cupin domain-containing protein n=1 Tax=Candidatus Arthromitus sp. SFB-rat-Yit TaxID=1041504 RepID=UPI000227A491|nr:cupin domain-containing protein [Candidatus Arthromitus sp. SFB-rat-Yit]BAK81557.1 cupin domain protein [Candidatus Arthromitus sp. SFB-rat-Yit]
MKNYTKTHVKEGNRTELHNTLSLTGAEVSVNTLPAGAGVPFIHSHKQNEEIVAILSGKGKAIIDGENIDLLAGDWIRISPKGQRQFFASENEAMTFVCIQVKENSLEGYTMEDGIIH